MRSSHSMVTDEALRLIAESDAEAGLKEQAAINVRRWLTADEYAEFVPQIRDLVSARDSKVLVDAFCQVIPFGTAGRRGQVGPGPNRINARTIAESFQGVCAYVRESKQAASYSAVVAYDTRHYSEEFARIGAEVLAANGVRTYLFAAPRPTPELSYAVRELGADIGFMVSASHNPPSDNGVKVYWADGGQIIPPHDTNIIEKVSQTAYVKQMPLAEARAARLVTSLTDGMDWRYRSAVLEEGLRTPAPPAALPRIVFSPLHGTGVHSVVPLLQAKGYRLGEQIVPMSQQWEPDGDFGCVRNRIPNPEEPVVLDAAIALAQACSADLVIASDPDADRLGVAIPTGVGDEWATLKGGYLSSLLTYYVLDELHSQGRLRADGVVVRTMVTSNLVDDIAASYGVACRSDLPVGFKWIARTIAELGDPTRFLFGTEQSYGNLKGSYCRDKDAAVAALLLTELCERLRAQGRTLYDGLLSLFARHGYYAERAVNVTFWGVEGRHKILRIMETLRGEPLTEIGGMTALEIADYWTAERRDPTTGAVRSRIESAFPPDDYLVWKLSEDGRNWVSVRPSGTEPKLKFYINLHEPMAGGGGGDEVREVQRRREELAAAIEQQLTRVAHQIADG